MLNLCLVRWLLVVVAVSAAALVGSSASRAAAPGTATSVPGWLDGAPAADPLQVSLEGSIHDFLTSDYDRMVKDGCAGPLTAYKDVARLHTQLQNALGSMETAHAALSQNAAASLALISSRVTQAALEAQVFFATLPAVESALAAESATAAATPAISELAKSVSNNVVALTKLVTQLRSAIEEGSIDKIDYELNALGAENAALALVADKFKTAAVVGDPAVGLLGQIAGAAKTLYDISDDIDQYHKTAGAAESAYLQAGAHYTTLLAQLKAAVTKMKSSVADCKQKTAPPHGKQTPRVQTPPASTTGCPKAATVAGSAPLVGLDLPPSFVKGNPFTCSFHVDDSPYFAAMTIHGADAGKSWTFSVSASTTFVEQGVAHPSMSDLVSGACVTVSGETRTDAVSASGVSAGIATQVQIYPKTSCSLG